MRNWHTRGTCTSHFNIVIALLMTYDYHQSYDIAHDNTIHYITLPRASPASSSSCSFMSPPAPPPHPPLCPRPLFKMDTEFSYDIFEVSTPTRLMTLSIHCVRPSASIADVTVRRALLQVSNWFSCARRNKVISRVSS